MDALKDWFQLLVSIIAIGSGLFATFKVIYEFRLNRQLRVRELRWRQASVARDALHEIHIHPLASAGTVMLDWFDIGHHFDINGKREWVSNQDIVGALTRPVAELTDEKAIYIRDCIDWFFFFMDRMEHYIRIDLIDFESVAPVYKFYARMIREHRNVFDPLMKRQGYDLAQAFLARLYALL